MTPVITALALFAAAACGGSKDAAPANNAASAAASAPAAAATVASAAGTASDSIGKQVFMTCTTCHQANGQGIPGTYPPLAGSEIATGPVELPIAIVLHGLNGPITVEGKTFNNVMTPWGPVFNDTQIAAVLTYVRSQWGNSAGPVTAAQVAAVREKTKSRTTMWTWPELKAFKF
jgi:mono/diheme cytochrome c family protein